MSIFTSLGDAGWLVAFAASIAFFVIHSRTRWRQTQLGPLVMLETLSYFGVAAVGVLRVLDLAGWSFFDVARAVAALGIAGITLYRLQTLVRVRRDRRREFGSKYVEVVMKDLTASVLTEPDEAMEHKYRRVYTWFLIVTLGAAATIVILAAVRLALS